jgi:hypothetical protein
MRIVHFIGVSLRCPVARIILPPPPPLTFHSHPDLAKWAKQYGYLPYTQHGQKVYCHAPVGLSGTFCLPSETLGQFMAKNEAPPVPKYVAGLDIPSM